jgi:hypothetical protein
MTRVSTLSVKQFTVQDDSAADAGGHHYRHEVVHSAGGP